MERRVEQLRQRQNKASPDAPRVLYIGRVPHGFYEAQMRGFFSQFGTVTRLRLSRNKKTGRSKHYAFVEFESPEVAAIVAECMHNYLLSGHILQARLVPTERQHAKLWKGANRKFRVLPRQREAREIHNRARSAEEVEKLVARQLKREDEKRRKLASAGIQYEFEGLREKLPKGPVHVKFSEEINGQ